MDSWRIYATLSGAGLVFFASVIVGLMTGLWLDGVLGTGALFTLALGALGLAGAVANLLRALRKISGLQ